MKLDYFSSLNYTLANEDSELELGVLPPAVEHVMAIAGSGARVLPLYAKSPNQVTCVDLSREQLYLTELRIESAKVLTYREYMGFWEYPPFSMEPKERKRVFKSVPIKPDTRRFFIQSFRTNHWQTLLYGGKWEKTIAKLSRINNFFTGFSGTRLFSHQNRAEYFQYLKNDFPHVRWAMTLAALGNANTFNTLLYKGNFPKKTIASSNLRFYLESFHKAFQQGPARNNFFLQLLFFGKIQFSEGNPIECNEKIFNLLKQGIKFAKTNYICGDIIKIVARCKSHVNFLSLSDVPSYLNPHQEQLYLQKMKRGLAQNSLTVARYYLKVPKNTVLKGYSRLNHHYEELIQREKTQMYLIDIFQKNSRYQSK